MIQAVKLLKKFESTVALNNIDIEIPGGSIYGLVGSNGSGKSTLLRIISGVYTKDGGEIIVDNMRTFNNPELKAKISYLADTPYFIHQSNLNEMVRFYQKMYPAFSTERFEELNRYFPIDRKARISTMSKGMQRQAALMLCLSTHPKYLLLDEAFDGLDPVMRKVLKSILSEGAAEGMTTIITSHNLRDLDGLCDSFGILHKGNVLLDNKIENLQENIHKIQLAFNSVPDMSVFDSLNVLKSERTGSFVQLVVKDDVDKIMPFLSALSPAYSEIVTPTFEEIFMCELEVNGYDIDNILK